jgi:peptidylprolyl isomerase
MAIAKAGDNVSVHYTGRLTNGQVFDSSEGRTPLEFTLGSGMVIPGFDNGITGMSLGEKKTVHISVEDAYGPADDNLILTFERNQLPADIPFEVGMQLNMHQDGNHQVVPVIVTHVTEEQITVDANHSLAGHELIFDIELVEIR